MKNVTYKLTGIAALIMHNVQLADPLSKASKLIKEITSKKNKSDADHAELSRIEWLGGLYTNEDGRIIVPAENIEGMIFEAAAKNKLKKTFTSSLYVEKSSVLDYDGPKNIDKLFEDGRFISKVSVKVKQSRVMRTRPMFGAWSLFTTVTYNDSILQENQINTAIKIAGAIVGIGDWRPKFGRFEVEKI